MSFKLKQPTMQLATLFFFFFGKSNDHRAHTDLLCITTETPVLFASSWCNTKIALLFGVIIFPILKC